MNGTYTTIQGDMWDGISYKVFGDVKYTDALMNANSKYRNVYVFSSGITLDIPDVETRVTGSNLPPWKRVSE